VYKDTGSIEGHFFSEMGVKKMFSQWNSKTNNIQRIVFFQQYLQEAITHIEDDFNLKLQNVPVIISGMASSSIGMEELPYALVPFSNGGEDLIYKEIPSSNDFQHDLMLISGLTNHKDIMRGEEVQIIGLASKINLNDCICILPGTHSKHIFIESEVIHNFKSFMTGEVFEIIRQYSILKESVATGDFSEDHKKAFTEGIILSRNDNFLHILFGIRAKQILQKSRKDYNFHLLSGMCIGTELTDLEQHKNKQKVVCAAGKLKRLYELGMSEFGWSDSTIFVDRNTLENLSWLGQRQFLKKFYRPV
jgi:2-dehydro-3-deoxygalactonokinase